MSHLYNQDPRIIDPGPLSDLPSTNGSQDGVVTVALPSLLTLVDMRTDLERENAQLKEHVERLDKYAKEIYEENATLTQQVRDLQLTVTDLEHTITELRQEVSQLDKRIIGLKSKHSQKLKLASKLALRRRPCTCTRKKNHCTNKEYIVIFGAAQAAMGQCLVDAELGAVREAEH